MNHRRVGRLWAAAVVGAALVAVGAALAASNAYCRFCRRNTLCRYQGVSDWCRARLLARGLREGDAELILELHNQLRARVATGREPRGYQPPAADMRMLVWDPQLELMAQMWVDQCKYAHDECRDLPRFSVGQNLFVVYGHEPDAIANWSATILSWYNEVEIFDTSNVDYLRTLGNSSHYSQMVTAATRALGCGHAAWREEAARPVTSMYACNYGPSGNRFGRPVYTAGRPCSRCPPAHVCDPALGLCESLFGALPLPLPWR